MQRIKCVIVDDESIARNLLIEYCGHLNVLEVVAVCGNALEAREVLLNQHIDLLFLDINMPLLDGIGFLKTVKVLPQFIFTTAYRKYALTAFDLAACDYLVKPFSLERFIQAVDRAATHLNSRQKQIPATHEFIMIKTENRIYNVNTEDLLFAEAKGNYTQIFLYEKMLKPKLAFSGFEKLLPSEQFIRVHRSFIINRTKIEHIEGNRIYINKHKIPIGNNFKKGFIMTLNSKK